MDTSFEEIRTEREFGAAVAALVSEAAANGVLVEGGWPCDDGGPCAWDIEIFELAGID
jgi:hypothetical protein